MRMSFWDLIKLFEFPTAEANERVFMAAAKWAKVLS